MSLVYVNVKIKVSIFLNIMHWYTEHLSYILSYLCVVSIFNLYQCSSCTDAKLSILSQKKIVILAYICKSQSVVVHSRPQTFQCMSYIKVTVSVLHQKYCVCLTSKWLCLAYIDVRALHWCWQICPTLMAVSYIDVNVSIQHWCQCLSYIQDMEVRVFV